MTDMPRALRIHHRQRVIAARVRLARDTKGWVAKLYCSKPGYFATYKPWGHCGNAHCPHCCMDQGENRQRRRSQRREGRAAERAE